MSREKSDRLMRISSQLDAEYENASPDPTTRRVNAEAIERTRDLDHLYRLTRSFPVWPFDMGSVRRFVAITATPFGIIVPILISLFA